MAAAENEDDSLAEANNEADGAETYSEEDNDNDDHESYYSEETNGNEDGTRYSSLDSPYALLRSWPNVLKMLRFPKSSSVSTGIAGGGNKKRNIDELGPLKSVKKQAC
jgi:hypothetical protein